MLVFGAMAFLLVLGQSGDSIAASAALPIHYLTALVRTFWLGDVPLAWGSLAALTTVAVASLLGAMMLFR